MKKNILFISLFYLLISSFAFSQTPGTLKWKCKIGYGTPMIGFDGTVYLSSHDELFALNPDGSQKWVVSTSDLHSVPAMDRDGTIYIGCEDFCALDPSGNIKWNIKEGFYCNCSPAIGADGTIYIGFTDWTLQADNFFALNPDGSPKWTFSIGYLSLFSSPAIAPDGTIYLRFGPSLYALNPDGSQKWRCELGDNWATSSPAIASDGTVYVGDGDSSMVAVKSNGKVKWMFKTNDFIESSPSIGSDGTIYFGSNDHYLYAIYPDGSLNWKFETGDVIKSSPTIGFDGTIYVGSFDQNLYAINPDGSQNWKFTTDGGIESSPALAPDGTLYFASWDYYLYALYTSSMGLAESPWPKFRKANNNSGLFTSLPIQDKIEFDIFTPGDVFQKSFSVSNTSSKSITIEQCNFDNHLFSLNESLPISIPAGTNKTMSATIIPDKTQLYQSKCKLNYQIDGEEETSFGYISTGFFLNDLSENSITASVALDAYNICMQDDSASIATTNNLGILYQLVGAPDFAEDFLLASLDGALFTNQSYSGIKMNLGVAKSDQNESINAKIYYDNALADFNVNPDSSAIAMQLYYNQAWEAYNEDSLDLAMTHIEDVISNNLVNNFLKAKAYVLRGAIKYANNDRETVISDFEEAKILDPDGPIGQMARENIDAYLTSVKDENQGHNASLIFTLLPNYPNPFNPQTTISFGLPENCKISLKIYNVLGQVVRTLINDYRTAGWHSISWNGIDDQNSAVTSGIYILELQADNFKSTRKITLMR